MRRVTWAVIIALGASAFSFTLHAQVRQTVSVENLQHQIIYLRREITALRKSLVDLRLRTLKLEPNTYIELNLTSHDFVKLDTITGSSLVSVREVSPYLDGYRVVLNIGNLSFATYTGFKLRVNWNRSYDWDKWTEASYEAWDKALREKEVSFTDSLKPGTWNKVELLLPSTKADELGYFKLSMETETLSLYKEP
jgi:hypothetical protein